MLNKFRKFRGIFIPDYAVIPLFFCLIGQLFAYYFSRVVNPLIYGGMENYYNIMTDLDQMIPVVPWWSVVYMLSYAFWVVNYIIACRDSQENCYRLIMADLMSKVVCFAIFVIMPTTITRPEVNGTDFGSCLLNYVYSIDTPDNLFPSMHCLISWFAFRYVVPCKRISAVYKWASLIMALLVFASVVFTKQHVVVDIFAGVLVAELFIQISNRTNLYKALEKFDCLDRIYGRKK